jgi:hypothetical protein
MYFRLPWIPEPSTVNNKLKRREGSGIQGNFRHAIIQLLQAFRCEIETYTLSLY